MIDISRLRVLVAVAREGSVTAAAEALHYAQPSVSHHLAKLAERAEHILAELEAVSAELDEMAGLRTGHVRLAAFPSALATIVPSAAARVAAEHPGVTLSLTEAEPPEALSALRNDDVDVALIFEHGAPG